MWFNDLPRACALGYAGVSPLQGYLQTNLIAYLSQVVGFIGRCWRECRRHDTLHSPGYNEGKARNETLGKQEHKIKSSFRSGTYSVNIGFAFWDHCIIRHSLRYYRHSGSVIYKSKLPAPLVSMPCESRILQSPTKEQVKLVLLETVGRSRFGCAAPLGLNKYIPLISPELWRVSPLQGSSMFLLPINYFVVLMRLPCLSF